MRGSGRPPVAVTTVSKGLMPIVVESHCGERDLDDL